jgi:hypothetical protein
MTNIFATITYKINSRELVQTDRVELGLRLWTRCFEALEGSYTMEALEGLRLVLRVYPKPPCQVSRVRSEKRIKPRSQR